ncbi:MAG: Bacterial Ig-like domain [Pseudomonadota bacterium]|jgi:hypothetical protein
MKKTITRNFLLSSSISALLLSNLACGSAPSGTTDEAAGDAGVSGGAPDDPSDRGGADEKPARGGASNAEDPQGDTADEEPSDAPATGGAPEDTSSNGGAAEEPAAGGASNAEGGAGGKAQEGAPAPSIPVGPSVLQSSPDNGAVGIPLDAPLQLLFSQPMNTASVEAALSITDIAPESLTFTWDVEKTEVTVVINGGLDAVEVIDPADLASVVPLVYVAKLEKSAMTESGTPMDQDLSVSFSTVRRVTVNLQPLANLTGSVRSDNTTFPPIWTGDSAVGDAKYIGVSSFDLSQIAPGAFLGSARLKATQSVINGDPTEGMGSSFQVYRTEFDARVWSKVNDDLTKQNYIAAQLVVSDSLNLNVETEVASALAGASAQAQFAFAFGVASDLDGSADNLLHSDVILTVVYEAP